MTDALLCLVVLCTPVTMQAYRTWDQLSWEYRLPPMSARLGFIAEGATAAQFDFDPEGRAVVVFDPFIPLETVRKSTAHEAYHTMLRARGIPYGGLAEERAANNFAYCWIGMRDYYPPRPCAEVLAEFAR